MITPYRIILSPIEVDCNYPGYIEGKHNKCHHYTEKELLARGDFVKDDSKLPVKWYHYITEEQFKKLWKPNIFYYITDPLLLFPGIWDVDWTMEFEESGDLF